MLNDKTAEGGKCFIFLGVSSSIVASGARESITYLCKNKLVDCVVATGRDVEYDIMKCFDNFYLNIDS